MKKFLAVISAIFALMSGVAFAQAGAADTKEAESPFYGRLELTHQATRNREDQQSLTGKLVYGEYAVSEKFSVTFAGFHDQEFWSAYPGIAYQVTEEFQFGLAGGRARYDGRNWTAVNPWAWYESGSVKAFLHAEYTRKDHDHPWYVKGYVEYKLGGRHFVGLHGESFLGIGPMFGTYLTEKIRVYAMIPVIDKADMRAMAGITIEF